MANPKYGSGQGKLPLAPWVKVFLNILLFCVPFGVISCMMFNDKILKKLTRGKLGVWEIGVMFPWESRYYHSPAPASKKKQVKGWVHWSQVYPDLDDEKPSTHSQYIYMTGEKEIEDD